MRTKFIKKMLKKHGLSHHYEVIEPLVRSAIVLNLKLQKQDNLPIGASKLGGRPDLPIGMDYPQQVVTKTTKINKKRFFIFNEIGEGTETSYVPFSFLGQINLEDIAKISLNTDLPKNGMLSFFYSQDGKWGFEKEDKEAFKVFYLKNELNTLSRCEIPHGVDKDLIYHPCKVSFKEQFNFPDDYYNIFKYNPDQPNNDEKDSYFDMIWDRDYYVVKMLGYADVVQSSPEEEFKDMDENNPANREWKNLIQFGSNDESGMNWVDRGKLYFGIREDRLKAHDFDHCWFTLQTY